VNSRLARFTAVFTSIVLVAVACGDDFERLETSDSGADAEDTAAPQDAVSDTGAGQDAASPKDVAIAPIVCKTDADCAALPVTSCQVRRCLAASSGSWCAAVALADATTCDDGDPCTLQSQCKAGKCAATGKNACGCKTDADCTQHDNGNACDGILVCDTSGSQSRCVVKADSAVACEPGKDTCKPAQCDPKDGACKPQPAADGVLCDDGDDCTTDDVCSAGTCAGATTICPCQEDADCAKSEDGNMCNGTLFCDKTDFPPKCVVKPGTLVTCSTLDDTDCTENTCDVKTGKCSPKAAKDKTACDDGDSCTASDICVDGACVSGANTCPCSGAADCAKYEDGDACNGTLYCDIAASKPTCTINPSTVSTCPQSDDACLTSGCDKNTGACSVKAKPNQTKCDDGDACTGGDHCEKGTCKPSAEICPCKSDKDCASASENKCLGARFCDKSAAPFQCRHNPALKVVCPITNDTECKTNFCSPKTGKCAFQSAVEGKACNADGNPCTKGDVCKSGACVAGTNVCPCEKDPDCGKFEDNDVCNGTLYCDTAKLPLRCQVNPKTVVVCKTVDDTACARNTCDPKTGACAMASFNENGPCNADDSDCTKGDFCSSGSCMAGKNQCGCTKDSECAAYDDKNACNGSYFCDKGQKPFTCALNPKTVVKCTASSNPCLLASCDPATGKCADKARPDGTGCSDGEQCTVADTCMAGKCNGKQICACLTDADCAGTNLKDLCLGIPRCATETFPATCQPDPNTAITCPNLDSPCAELACQPTTGACALHAKPDTAGKTCDDDNPCTLKTTCSKLQCGGGATRLCDDANKCTADGCDVSKSTDPKTGCFFFKLSNQTCNDGDKCTEGDVCTNGSCEAGPKKDCDDNKPCTQDSCGAAVGCEHKPASGTSCSDGDNCTEKDICVSGKCEGTKKDCDDGFQCTEDECRPNGMCDHKPPPPPGMGDASCDAGKGGQKGTCKVGQKLGEFLCCDTGGCVK